MHDDTPNPSLLVSFAIVALLHVALAAALFGWLATISAVSVPL